MIPSERWRVGGVDDRGLRRPRVDRGPRCGGAGSAVTCGCGAGVSHPRGRAPFPAFAACTPLGPDALAPTGLPVWALGGVDPTTAAACMAAGAHGVAVMGAVMRAPDPGAVVAELCRVVHAGST